MTNSNNTAHIKLSNDRAGSDWKTRLGDGSNIAFVSEPSVEASYCSR